MLAMARSALRKPVSFPVFVLYAVLGYVAAHAVIKLLTSILAPLFCN